MKKVKNFKQYYLASIKINSKILYKKNLKIVKNKSKSLQI